MGTKLSQKDLDLYNYIDEVIFYEWDPIGISTDPSAPRNEYQSYLPTVYSMIKNGNSDIEIANYLAWIQRDRIGLNTNESFNLKIAKMIKAYSEKL